MAKRKVVREYSREFPTVTRGKTKAYTIRNIPPKLWTVVQARSKREGISLRLELLRFLAAFAAGAPRVDVIAREEPAPVEEPLPRNRATGRYTDRTFEKPCTCGHTLGDHTAERVGEEQPCLQLDCPCDGFTVAVIARTDAPEHEVTR